MDGRMDIRKNGQIISPFYRTLSPIGAAALLPLMKTADHSMYLMPLGDWCSMCYKEKKIRHKSARFRNYMCFISSRKVDQASDHPINR